MPCEKNFPKNFKNLDRFKTTFRGGGNESLWGARRSNILENQNTVPYNAGQCTEGQRSATDASPAVINPIQHRNLGSINFNKDHRTSIQENIADFNYMDIPRSRTINYELESSPNRSSSRTFKKHSRPKDILIDKTQDHRSKEFEEKYISKLFEHLPELWNGPWCKMLENCKKSGTIVSEKFKRIQIHKPNHDSTTSDNTLDRKNTAFYQTTHNGGICLLEVNILSEPEKNFKKSNSNQDNRFKLIFTIYSLKYVRMQIFDEFVRHQHQGRMISAKELNRELCGSYQQQMVDMKEFNSLGVIISNNLLVQTCIKDIEFEILCDHLRIKFEDSGNGESVEKSLNIFPSEFNYCGFLKNYLKRMGKRENDGK